MKNRKREICTSGSVRDEDGQPPHLLGRRNFLHLTAGAAALPAVSRIARAQTYPSRPVRIIIGFAPGGVVEIVARLIGQSLSERLGQPFIIESRPGAASNIATEAVVRAPPDGYTLLVVSSANAINATLYDKLNFVFLRDIAPIASIIRHPFVMVVNPSVPAKTVPEFIAYAKANPGKLTIASGGIGAATHLAGELFKVMTSVDIVHVPYRGLAASLTDLLGGQVQVTFASVPSSIAYIKAGRLTVGEFVPGYETSLWLGLGAPKGTPAEIIDTLNQETNAALTDLKIKARLADLGGTVLPGTPADFGKLIAEETEKWGRVVKFAGLKAD